MDVAWKFLILLAATVACHYAVQRITDHLGARWRSRRELVQKGPDNTEHMSLRASSRRQRSTAQGRAAPPHSRRHARGHLMTQVIFGMFILAMIAIVILTYLAHRASQKPPTRAHLDHSGQDRVKHDRDQSPE